ncbi:hypothetical protein [Desulfovibrio sp. ZJ200]|uniref:hypothetical protein n=1 Tax=Desulfovibrio sp. ZJ200 TaxID=2709792 RepID=UPI00197D9587|nr:hypothetical protein [Desulfovibrio sp. ZJ200]
MDVTVYRQPSKKMDQIFFKEPLIYSANKSVPFPERFFASLGKARQFVPLTGKVNFSSSRLAGGLAKQDYRKRFNQRFLKY